MKKVEAVIQGFKVDKVREALANEKIPRITIFEVKGAGNHQGNLKAYRGAQYVEDSVDIKIEIVADDDEAERIAQVIINALRTGDLGDGEVIIVPIEQIFRLRVGQRGHRVPNWKHDPAPSYQMRNTTSFRSYLKALRRKFHEAG
jgi:nitrogen regulatory protein P-II 1